MKHMSAATGSVAQIGPAGLVDQDGGRVGADREEGAMAQRDLAVEAGQQDEAQHGDGIDDHQD